MTEQHKLSYDFIKLTRKYQSNAVKDYLGKLSVGYHHTINVYPKTCYDILTADAILKEDIDICHYFIRKKITKKLTTTQHIAITSLLLRTDQQLKLDSPIITLINNRKMAQTLEYWKTKYVIPNNPLLLIMELNLYKGVQ